MDAKKKFINKYQIEELYIITPDLIPRFANDDNTLFNDCPSLKKIAYLGARRNQVTRKTFGENGKKVYFYNSAFCEKINGRICQLIGSPNQDELPEADGVNEYHSIKKNYDEGACIAVYEKHPLQKESNKEDRVKSFFNQF